MRRRRWAIGIGADQGAEATASPLPDLWLGLADEITIKLLLEQLRRTPGLKLTVESDHLEPWRELLPVAVTNILATESFLDLEGLDEATLSRFRPADQPAD